MKPYVRKRPLSCSESQELTQPLQQSPVPVSSVETGNSLCKTQQTNPCELGDHSAIKEPGVMVITEHDELGRRHFNVVPSPQPQTPTQAPTPAELQPATSLDYVRQRLATGKLSTSREPRSFTQDPKFVGARVATGVSPKQLARAQLEHQHKMRRWQAIYS